MPVAQTMNRTVDDRPDERLVVEVTTSRMVHGTEFKRICKSVQHLYYFSLFTQAPEYERSPGSWESWLAVGTDLAVREAPRAVSRADRYLESVYSGPRVIRITVRGNRRALEALVRILGCIEAVRSTLPSQDADNRRARVLADPAVQAAIAVPLADACRAAEMGRQDTEHFATLLGQSLAALAGVDILAVTVRLPAERVTSSGE